MDDHSPIATTLFCLTNLVNFDLNLECIIVGFGWSSFPNCCGVLGFGKFGIDTDVLGKNG